MHINDPTAVVLTVFMIPRIKLAPVKLSFYVITSAVTCPRSLVCQIFILGIRPQSSAAAAAAARGQPPSRRVAEIKHFDSAAPYTRARGHGS